jgi:formylglycine-generating enzyme required for sulfatase activity
VQLEKDLQGELSHIVRGGSYLFERINARSTYRFAFMDIGRAQDVGWRCARNVAK